MELCYVVVHKLPNTGITNRASDDGIWVISERTGVLGAEFRATMPARQLVSTPQAVAETRKAVADSWGMEPEGAFHTYVCAEVTCTGAQTIQSFCSYSPEMYVRGTRCLNRMSVQP